MIEKVCTNVKIQYQCKCEEKTNKNQITARNSLVKEITLQVEVRSTNKINRFIPNHHNIFNECTNSQ